MCAARLLPNVLQHASTEMRRKINATSASRVHLSSHGPNTGHRFTLQPEHSPQTSPLRLAMQAALSAEERHTATDCSDKRARVAPGPWCHGRLLLRPMLAVGCLRRETS